MSEENLDSLLKRMGEIAKAVNAFNSETVQQEAFSALVAAFQGKHPPSSAQRHTPNEGSKVPLAPEAEPTTPDPKIAIPTAATDVSRARRGVTKENFKVLKDINLRPPGTESFEEFIAKKQPSHNEAKYPAIVYWLTEIAQISNITKDHIGTVFRLMKDWRELGNLSSGLSVCAARKGTIDVSNSADIRLTPHGRNFVEHDLPETKKKAK